jgi:hypothetical protein
MRNIILLFAVLAFLGNSSPLFAQFANQVPRSGDWTGSILKTDQNEKNLLGRFGFSMNHSYEMSFTNFGGQSYNQNMYTNTMFLRFSDRMQGRVDLSLAHSPFGNGLMTQGSDVRFLVRNAELNYRLGEKSQVSLQFSQMPNGYYGGPFDRYGYGNNFYRNNRWNSAGNPFYPPY